MDKTLVTLLIISLGSFSAQVQAISEHSLPNAPTEVTPASVTQLLTQVSQLTPFSEPKPTLNTLKTASKRDVQIGSKRAYNKIIQFKTTGITGATGMFRRVVNAPSAGGKQNNSVESHASVSKTLGMTLSADISAGMGLQAKDFVWSIKSADGSLSKQKKGKRITANLPAGKYKVTLKLAGNTLSKTITLGTNHHESSFKITLGKVKASVSLSGKAAKSSWRIYKMKGSKRGKAVYSIKKASAINHVLAPGKYELVVALGSVSSSKVVTVASGKVNKSTLRLEGSKVKLLVTKSDLKSPLIKKNKMGY